MFDTPNIATLKPLIRFELTKLHSTFYAKNMSKHKLTRDLDTSANTGLCPGFRTAGALEATMQLSAGYKSHCRGENHFRCEASTPGTILKGDRNWISKRTCKTLQALRTLMLPLLSLRRRCSRTPANCYQNLVLLPGRTWPKWSHSLDPLWTSPLPLPRSRYIASLWPKVSSSSGSRLANRSFFFSLRRRKLYPPLSSQWSRDGLESWWEVVGCLVCWNPVKYCTETPKLRNPK